MKIRILLILAMCLTLGCDRKGGDPAGETTAKTNPGKPVVVATTTMLTDLARQIGGDDVRVEGIMKPGGDPHLYQPTPGDARTIASSQMVITSGLYLEGWIDDLVRTIRRQRYTLLREE